MEFWHKVLIGVVLFASTRFMDNTNTLLVGFLRFYTVICLSVVFATWAYMWQEIMRKKDRRTVIIETKTNNIQMVTWGYDKDKLKNTIIRRSLVLMLVTFMHFHFKALPPILVAPTMNILFLIDDPLFLLHVLKVPETPDLERPFGQKTKTA